MTPYTEGAGPSINPSVFMPRNRDDALSLVKYELYHLLEHLLLQPDFDTYAIIQIRTIIDCIERS